MKRLLIIWLLCPVALFGQNVVLNTDEAQITFDIDDVEGGTISGLNAEVNLNLEDPSSSTLKASLDVTTIDTDTPSRDGHLVEEDEHFDGANHPEITYESDNIVKTATGYMAYGQITIKGTTMDQKMPFIHKDGMLIGRMKLHTGHFGVYGQKPENEGAYNCVVRIQVPVR